MDETDVTIEGDPEAQQGIRYNIYQLYQTYRGDDPRLNIGPKGFTGEKYGGNTYWNTELCCVPFFLLSTPKKIAENLLMYRYKQLPKAIENARKLGFATAPPFFRKSPAMEKNAIANGKSHLKKSTGTI